MIGTRLASSRTFARRYRSAIALAAALVTGTITGACGSAANSPASGGLDGGGGGGPGDAALSGDVVMLGTSDSAPSGVLTITPATTVLTITNVAAPPTQAFAATFTTGGSSTTVTPNWTLVDYTVGLVDSSGTFTPEGAISGDVTVVATYEGMTAQATIHVAINAQSTLSNVTLPDGTNIPQDGTSVTPPDLTALNGTPVTEEAGTGSTLIYPYDQTVFPRGLLAPVLEYTAGAIAPVDFKVSLDTTAFHWDGFGHVGNPSALQGAVPQNIWDGALLSAQPDPTTHKAVVTLSLVKAAAGVAYGPYQAHLIIAPGQLTGVIYYESYGSDTVEPDAGGGNGGTDFGLWAVKPGSMAPPKNLESGCIICHGVSAAGNTLTAGTDDPTVGGNSGVFRLEADGGMTHLATAPTILPYPIGAVDSRGLGWATLSPDGQVALRGVNQFWGGQSLLAWAVPSSPLLEDDGGIAPLSTSMTVTGDFNMFVPSYSVDGNHLVYINAANTGDAGSAGAPSQSVGIVDIAATVADGGTGGSVTLSNPRTVYDSTASGATPAGTFTKVPTFLPDSQTVVLEETVTSYTGYDHMLPDYGGVDGALYALQPNAAAPGGYSHVALANANAGYDPTAPTHNYEPKALPVQVGGYYWVVFASVRADAYPNATPKKLWVTAITPGASPGTDPSHPPFTLINQSIVPAQPSQRGYWALSPCQQNGTSCVTSADCCNGSCLPQDPTNPSSPLVCGAPPAAACVSLGGRCRAGHNEDCCDTTASVQCIGTLNGYGTCGTPAPQ